MTDLTIASRVKKGKPLILFLSPAAGTFTPGASGVIEVEVSFQGESIDPSDFEADLVSDTLLRLDITWPFKKTDLLFVSGSGDLTVTVSASQPFTGTHPVVSE
jgi:hypothetical protein